MSIFGEYCKKGLLKELQSYVSNSENSINKYYSGHCLFREGFEEACCHGHTNIVEYLINMVDSHMEYNNQINKNKIHYNIGESICVACREGHYDLIKYFMNNKTIFIIHISRMWSDNIFRTACMYGHLDIIKYLIDNSSELDITIHIGERELIESCTYDNVNVVKYLLEQDKLHVDIHIHNDDDEELSFRTACNNGCINIMKYFLDICHDIDIHNPLIFTQICCREKGFVTGKHLIEIAYEYSGRDIDILYNNAACFQAACGRYTGCFNMMKYLICVALRSKCIIDIHNMNRSIFINYPEYWIINERIAYLHSLGSYKRIEYMHTIIL